MLVFIRYLIYFEEKLVMLRRNPDLAKFKERLETSDKPDNKDLTELERRGLDYLQVRSLNNSVIRQLIASRVITFDIALGLTLEQQDDLTNPRNLTLMADGIVTAGQLMRSNRNQQRFLQKSEMQDLITKHRLTVDEVLNSDLEQREALEIDVVYRLVADGSMLSMKALRLTFNQKENFKSKMINEMLSAGTITISEILTITRNQRLDLENENTREATLTDIIDRRSELTQQVSPQVNVNHLTDISNLATDKSPQMHSPTPSKKLTPVDFRNLNNPDHSESEWRNEYFIGYGIIITVNKQAGQVELEISDGRESGKVILCDNNQATKWIRDKSLQYLLKQLKVEKNLNWIVSSQLDRQESDIEQEEKAIKILEQAVKLERARITVETIAKQCNNQHSFFNTIPQDMAEHISDLATHGVMARVRE